MTPSFPTRRSSDRHLLADQRALGVPDREAGTELVGEAEQVELHTELAVVSLGCLLEAVDVLLERLLGVPGRAVDALQLRVALLRSEEHTSELQSLMRISYAVFCLKKKKI